MIGDPVLSFDILIMFESFRHVHLLLEHVRTHHLVFFGVHARIN